MTDRVQTVAGRWLAAAVGVLAGSALQLQQPVLGPAWAAPAALAAGLVLGLAGRRRAWAVALAAGLLAFGAAEWRAASRLAQQLAPALEGQDLVVTGVVSQMPRSTLAGTRFVLDVEGASRRGEPVELPPRLSLGWYRGVDVDRLIPGAPVELRAGQRWRLTLRLKRPHGAFNPQGFDFELWLFEQGLGATGYVRGGAELLAERAGRPFERARQAIRDRIARQVPDAATAGLLAALVVGDQAAIERDDWDLFRATGVAHLMSISGLHVTMFAWLAGALVAAAWRRSAHLVHRLPTPMAARWGGLAAALGYAVLAGWGVPAQRTVWMIATVVVLRAAGVRWPLPAVLLAAAVVVTALDPWALLQPGFWLSFVAVALLAGSDPARHAGDGAPPLPRWRAALQGGLRSQLVATIGLAPLSMLFFQQVSVVGFVANLVAIPAVTLLVTPLAMLGVLVPPLWTLAAWAAQALMALLQLLATAPLVVWSAAAAPPWAVAAGLLGGALAVLPLPWRLRALAVPLVLPLLAPPVERPPPGRFEAVVLDVGQGTAVLVRTTNRLLVYDAGPSYSPEADAGQRVLLPLLRARGEPRVDLLVLSHRDTDHVGGAASLMAGVPVAALRSSLEPTHPLLARGVPHQPCEAGQAWTWDGVRFELLHPSAAALAAGGKPNTLSCVLRVVGEGASMLLAGDLEAAQESALVAAGTELRADVLVVPHHGSRTSSTPAFIDAVAPRTAVFQAGYRSRFGHPAPDIVARYEARAITTVRSDRCGAWTLPPAGTPWCERQVSSRYWHHRP